MTRRALIHGTGLIGASIGLALRRGGWDVAGWDPDPRALETARERGALSHVLPGPELTDVDLLVLAGPPSATISTIREIDVGCLVTDVAGVKAPIIEAARHLPHFVGGHPMAGGATGGASLASSHLFHGASWVLTTDGAADEDLSSVEETVRAIGANPIRMTAAEHDAAVARISHLPHLLAAALMRLAGKDPHALSLAGGGFRDLTRVAASDVGWWVEIFEANAAEVLSAITAMQEELTEWKTYLDDTDTVAAAGALESARATRARLGDHHAQVRVVLFDRPGEIARVGHALESSGADVRDFQLRHGEHGGGGILTISVTPATVNDLSSALVGQGFMLED